MVQDLIDNSPVTNTTFLENIKKCVSHIDYGIQGLKTILETYVGTPFIFEIQDCVEKIKNECYSLNNDQCL